MSSADHLIERVARALWDEPGWEQASHEQRQHHREAAERALEAVAPLIAAQALEDMARFANRVYRNSLVPRTLVLGDLRERAAKLRGAGDFGGAS